MSLLVPQIHLQSAQTAPADRLALLRDALGDLLGMTIDAGPQAHVDVRVFMVGSLAIIEGEASAHSAERSLADGADHVLLVINRTGRCEVTRPGRILSLAAGDAAFIDPASPFRWRRTVGTFLILKLPKDLVGGLDLAEALPAQIGATDASMALIELYMRTIDRLTPDTMPVIAAHLADLALLAFRRAVQPQSRPTVETVKRDIRANLARHSLSAEIIAQWYGMTERTLQRLFERSGETVAGFIMAERLGRAHARLIDGPDKIGAIARECGFSSASTFNVAFRRHFGTTPSALREGSARP